MILAIRLNNTMIVKAFIILLILVHDEVWCITKDWSYVFDKSLIKNNITLWDSKQYDCKIDIDKMGDVYAYCNDVFIGTSKTSAVDRMGHNCYPGSASKRCDVFSLHDGDYCGKTHRTGIVYMQCSIDKFEGLIGVSNEDYCHTMIGIAVNCPEKFFIPTFAPTIMPTLSVEESNYTMLSNLPYPKQTEHRLLVTITASALREQIQIIQLQHYVDICNAGWEVHVVIITGQKIWEIPQYQYIWQSSMFYCDRLTRMLPVVVQWSTDGRLAAKHRRVFKELIDRYDFFLSAEDDMIIKLQHIHYYAKWSSKLAGSGFYPGFNTVELPTAMTKKPYSVNHRDNPMIWRSFTSSYDQAQKYFQVFKHNGELFLYYMKDWAPVFIISRELLLQHVSQPYWLGDELKKYNEYNTHFQHMWLAWHYKLVVPLHDFWLSWIHHSPDRYIGLSFDKMQETSDPNNTDHEVFHNYYNHLPTVAEFDLFLEDCTGTKIAVPRGYDIIHHKNNSNWHQTVNYEKDIKCSTCLEHNHFATVTIKFRGNYSFLSKISNIDAGIVCQDSYINQERSVYT